MKALLRLYQGHVKALLRLCEGCINALLRLCEGYIKALLRLCSGSITASALMPVCERGRVSISRILFNARCASLFVAAAARLVRVLVYQRIATFPLFFASFRELMQVVAMW